MLAHRPAITFIALSLSMLSASALFVSSLSVVALPAYAQNEALVWTGGIGIDERAAAPAEGTKLVFFIEAGNFLADVQVNVKDESGRDIVDAVSKGPWMILKLAPGRYSVQATVAGETQGGTIDVTGNNQEFAYMFKAR
ncbi:MAG TPA: hypothetical protein VGE69_11810 [Pseudomonadales bacterium]